MSRSAEPRRGKSGAGLIPARQITSDAAALSPKGTSSVDAARPNRTRSMLVGLQAAASLLLLVTAGLLTRGMMQATRVDIGFASDSLLLVSPAFGRRAVEEQTASYWSAALDSIRALPDVRGVSRASFPPYLGASKVTIFKRAGSRYVINHNETDPEYFTVIGLRVVRRRTYTRDEAAAGANVAVISESLARDFFPGEDPLGQSLERVVPGSSRIVVGVVSNAITSRLRELSSAAIYEPLRAGGTVRLVVRSEGPPEALIPAVRTALNQIDPRIRVVMQSVGDAVRRQLAEPRTLAALVGVMAGIALTLAIVGIYGVTAFVVKQRTHEISVRIALGATSRDVVGLLLRESMRPVAAGLAAGVVGALLTSRVFSGVLYGVSSLDPVAFAGAGVLLLSAAATAVFLPTRRAASVEPAVVLRQL